MLEKVLQRMRTAGLHIKQNRWVLTREVAGGAWGILMAGSQWVHPAVEKVTRRGQWGQRHQPCKHHCTHFHFLWCQLGLLPSLFLKNHTVWGPAEFLYSTPHVAGNWNSHLPLLSSLRKTWIFLQIKNYCHCSLALMKSFISILLNPFLSEI